MKPISVIGKEKNINEAKGLDIMYDIDLEIYNEALQIYKKIEKDLNYDYLTVALFAEILKDMSDGNLSFKIQKVLNQWLTKRKKPSREF